MAAFYHYCFSNWLIIPAPLILFVLRECSLSLSFYRHVHEKAQSVSDFPRPQLFSLVYYKQGWLNPMPVISSPFMMLLNGVITSKMSIFSANPFPSRATRKTTKIPKTEHLPLTVLCRPGLVRCHLRENIYLCLCLSVLTCFLFIPVSPLPHTEKLSTVFSKTSDFCWKKKEIKIEPYSFLDQFSTGFDHCLCQSKFRFNHLQHIDSWFQWCELSFHIKGTV